MLPHHAADSTWSVEWKEAETSSELMAALPKIVNRSRHSVSRESLEEAPEQGRDQAGAGGSAEAAQEAGSSPAGSKAVRSAMANTRTAELASLAEQADIRQALRECACWFTCSDCKCRRTVPMCLFRHVPVRAREV